MYSVKPLFMFGNLICGSICIQGTRSPNLLLAHCSTQATCSHFAHTLLIHPHHPWGWIDIAEDNLDMYLGNMNRDLETSLSLQTP